MFSISVSANVEELSNFLKSNTTKLDEALKMLLNNALLIILFTYFRHKKWTKIVCWMWKKYKPVVVVFSNIKNPEFSWNTWGQQQETQ